MRPSAILFSTALTLVAGTITRQDPQSIPPAGLKPNQVPQFVTIGFDDNSSIEGMDWIVNYLKSKKIPPEKDSRPHLTTLLCTSVFT